MTTNSTGIRGVSTTRSTILYGIKQRDAKEKEKNNGVFTCTTNHVI
jgi:hypothetical protein